MKEENGQNIASVLSKTMIDFPDNLNDSKVIFKLHVVIGKRSRRFLMFLIRREKPFLFWGMKAKWFEFCFTRGRIWYRPIIRFAIRNLFSRGKEEMPKTEKVVFRDFMCIETCFIEDPRNMNQHPKAQKYFHEGEVFSFPKSFIDHEASKRFRPWRWDLNEPEEEPFLDETGEPVEEEVTTPEEEVDEPVLDDTEITEEPETILEVKEDARGKRKKT